MIKFIENIESPQFYIPPTIAPFSIRKYGAGVNTSNNVFQSLEDGAFFVSVKDLDASHSKDSVYFTYDLFGNLITQKIKIKTGEMEGFIIDGGEWS